MADQIHNSANKNAQNQTHKKATDSSSVALTAMALQDHWTRKLSLSTNFGPRKVGAGPATRASQKKKQNIRPVVDTGRSKSKKFETKTIEDEREYVLDEKPPPLTLAQKFGLVQAPKQLLSESEWSGIKAKSNQRDDSGEPCVICKEDFGLQEQVILSCTHVFHKACLQAFERFTGRKTCPMCRHEQYQTRVIHEGARVYKHKSAARIQACWRGYIVRSWYKKLRETVPPNDPLLRKKFYEEKLTSIVDRMIKSVDVNMADFLREIDSSIQQSRAVFSEWDAVHNPITPKMWEAIQLKAVERGDTDCPICLTELYLGTSQDEGFTSTSSPKTSNIHNHQHSPTDPGSQRAHCHDKRPSRKQNDKKLLEKLSGSMGYPSMEPVANTPNLDEGVNTNTKVKSENRDKNHNSMETKSAMPETAQGGVGNSGPISKSKTKSTFVTQSTLELEGGKGGARRVRATVLLSCTHVFHSTCLRTLEEMAMIDMRNTCPVCRSHYQKKVVVF